MKKGRSDEATKRRRGGEWALAGLVIAGVTAAWAAGQGAPPTGAETIKVIEDQTIHWDRNAAVETDAEGYVIRYAGQTIERTVTLPDAPARPADTPRIVARVEVEPMRLASTQQPGDPWNRIGSLSVLAPPTESGEVREIELVRFITGYGSPGTYEQDITALAPHLFGTRTFRLFLSSYSDEPGWRVSLSMSYSDEGVGYRRPVLAEPVFLDRHVAAEDGGPSRLTARITIPGGLARPRLRILSTGHASDGRGGNEFVTSTHILWAASREVARWRPWREGGGATRAANLWAGREEIDGREVWVSDFDRSGWLPNSVVEPLIIPLPELQPGANSIELQIRDIRQKGEDGGHGYWVVSAVVIADEPLK